jgi:hypothetical protein
VPEETNGIDKRLRTVEQEFARHEGADESMHQSVRDGWAKNEGAHTEMFERLSGLERTTSNLQGRIAASAAFAAIMGSAIGSIVVGILIYHFTKKP